MNLSLPVRRLIWKELRLITPLIVALAGLAFLALLLMPGAERGYAALVFIGIPLLYSVGAGPILISMEKEQRTLLWNRSLPIDLTILAKTKLSMALVGWIASWLISLILVGPILEQGDILILLGKAPLTSAAQDFLFGQPLLYSLLHSLFLLLAGFAIAWRSQSTWLAIFGILAVSFIPSLGMLSFTTIVWLNDHSIPHDYAPVAVLVLIQLCSIAIAAWLVRRESVLALRPEKITSQGAWFGVRQFFEGHANRFTLLNRNSVMSPTTALIWLQLRQNGWLLALGCSLLLLLFATGFGQLDWSYQSVARYSPILSFFKSVSPAVVILVGLIGCWTFQSDSSKDRIRFLSERGTSIKQYYWMRILLPFAFLAVAFLASTPFHHLFARRAGQLANNDATVAVVFVFCLGWLGYGAALWSSYLTRSPVIASLLAPYFVGLSIVYALTTYRYAAAPIWLLLLIGFLPFFAMRLTILRWMERRLQLRHGLIHFAMIVAWFLIPLIPLFWTFATIFRIDRSTQAELQHVINQRPSLYRENLEVTRLSFKSFPIYELDKAKSTRPKSLYELIEQNVDYVEAELTKSTGPIVWSSYDNRQLMTLAVLARLRWIDLNSKGDAVSAEAEANKYNRLMRLQLAIVKRVRLCPRIGDQDSADRITVSLLNELHQEGSLKLLDQANRKAARELFLDRKGRFEARNRSIALSYREYRRDLELDRQVNLGGITFYSNRITDRSEIPFGLYVEELKIRNLGDRLTSELWSITHKSPQEITFADRKRVVAATNSEWAMIMRPFDDASISELSALIDQDQIPIPSLWNGKWEIAAEDFARKELVDDQSNGN